MHSQHHVFQNQYSQDPSWLQHHQGHHSHPQTHQSLHHSNHAQAVAQHQHYNRIAANNGPTNGHALRMDHGAALGTTESNSVEENARVLGWVAELLNGNSRETALMELSKKREQVGELALIIWHSFGSSPSYLTLSSTLTVPLQVS